MLTASASPTPYSVIKLHLNISILTNGRAGGISYEMLESEMLQSFAPKIRKGSVCSQHFWTRFTWRANLCCETGTAHEGRKEVNLFANGLTLCLESTDE